MEKNKILPENLEADIRSRDQIYGPKFHSGRTVQSVTGNFIFTSRSHSSCSLILELF